MAITTVLLGGCTANLPPARIAPTPTPIPGISNFKDTQWKKFTSRRLGLTFNYPATWAKTAESGNEVVFTGLTVTKLPHSQPLDNRLKSFTLTQNSLPAVMNPTQALIFFNFGQDSYELNYSRLAAQSDSSLILGRIIDSIDLNANTTAFTCPKGDYTKVDAPPEFYFWAENNCR